ncbi:hypothetical protein ZIOFF_070245 [Zingiber officinale]|uniref:Uncharacterized protein n=1 Tax=Zingiber officinale TaxID=94328 RepID=A0A8J5CCS7_ZINOF|nr:hypothetical protein ZIOFF_070245 [Zingiber officinale]
MGGFPLLDLKSMAVMRKTPGLSSYLGDPELSEESLVELLEFAKEKVSNDWHKVTEVRLMATAGLRMVEVGLRERTLESCRRVLRLSGFQFKDDWATVIPVVANYALGSLGSDPENTTGILELGGASAQEWDALMLSNFALENQLHTARQKLSHLCISSATNRLITAKDHASVQINIGHLDDSGVYTGQYTTFALSGFIRAQIMEESETSKENAERPPRVDHWAEKGSIP